MIAVVQSLPKRSKILKQCMVVAHPTAREQLTIMDHHIRAQGATLSVRTAATYGRTENRW
eukprot:5191278-Karenia_brevis.AAC.1